MKTRHHVFAAAALLALIAAIFAALYWPSPMDPPRPPPPIERLTVAVNFPYISSGLVHLAAANGYFAAEGLDVTLQPHTSGRAALDALIGGQAQMATAAGPPFVIEVTRGVPLSVIATLAKEAGTHALLARRDRGVAALADLKGKTIGVTPTSSAHFMLAVMLAGAGVGPADAVIKPLKPDEMSTALLSGQVDAIATWEPWLNRTRIALGDRSLVVYPESDISFGFYLGGKRDFVREHPEAMKKLLRALWRAEQYWHEEPAAARAIIAAAATVDTTLAGFSWDQYSLHLTLDQQLLNLWEDKSRWAIDNGFVAGAKVPNFLDTFYLDAMLAVKPQAMLIVR